MSKNSLVRFGNLKKKNKNSNKINNKKKPKLIYPIKKLKPHGDNLLNKL